MTWEDPSTSAVSPPTFWWTNILLWKITMLLMGKSTINGNVQLQTVSSPEGTWWFQPRVALFLWWWGWWWCILLTCFCFLMGETCKLKKCVGQMLAWNDLTPLFRRTVSGLLFGPPRKVLWRRGAPLMGWWRHWLEWWFYFSLNPLQMAELFGFLVNDVVYQLIRSSTKSRTQKFHILSINCSWSQQHERASRCWQHPWMQFQNKEQRLKPYQQHPATKTYSCASCRANTPGSPPSQSTQHQNTWQIGARMLQCFSVRT